MTDIVERLRQWPDEPINNVSMLREAADEIERLRTIVIRGLAGVELSEENDRLIDEIERLRGEKT